jgi:F0F1-type ATP synthase assembly protein I
MTISLEMAIPPVLGIWLDRRLGTVALFLIVGCVLGMTVAGLQLMKIAQTGSSRDETRRQPRDANDQD